MGEDAIRVSNRGALRSLYVCYLSLEDPLVQTQVVAYLAGLSRLGHTIHLLTFETSRLTRSRRREIRAELAKKGIAWHGLRYHKRPSLLATFVSFSGRILPRGCYAAIGSGHCTRAATYRRRWLYSPGRSLRSG